MKEKEEGSGNKNEDIEIERIKAKKMREMEARMKSKKEGKKGEQLIDHPLTLDDSSFIPTVRKYPLVVVDCWAPWCAPCRMVAPIIDELAREYAGKVVFGKLNVDENPRIASEFAIMAIPTMFIFKNGEPVDVIQGALPKPYLEAKLREWI
ncbi:MAG: thioredoxin [Methanophagales archaeon]|nr:thioredoxin [Methanophagales archaeon]